MTGSPPPELVQQRGFDQTFLTDWGPQDDGFGFNALLPLDHPRYSDTSTPFHDLLVIAEAVSQAGMVSTINLLGVSPDSEFFMRRLSASLDPLPNNLREPDSRRLLLSTHDGTAGVKFRPDGSSSGAFLSTTNTLEGRPSGRGHAQAFWMPTQRYKQFRARLRRRHTPRDPVPSALEPEALTGRENPENSVISTLEPLGEGRYGTILLLDPRDPTFFDPPLDHVGGFLLCEAAKQAATAAASRELDLEPSEFAICSGEISFVSFAELDDITECAIGQLAGATVEVEFSQSGRTVCRASLEVQRL